MAKALTTLAIKNLKPQAKRIEIPDGHSKARGLRLVLQPTGAMSWAFRYEFAGRSRKLTLGPHPALDIPAARRAVEAAREKLGKGEDPAAQKADARRKATVADLCSRYLVWLTDDEDHKPNTIIENTRYIRTMIEPALGKKIVEDVTMDDAERFLKDVFNRRTAVQLARNGRGGDGKTAPATMNRCRAVLRSMFELAESRFKMRPKGTNPVSGVSMKTENARGGRKRLAQPEELPRLSEALDFYGVRYPRHVAAIWTLLLTGARVNEIALMRANELRSDRIVKNVHKTDANIGSKDILLPAQAQELFRKLEPVDGYVFGKIALRHVWEKVRERAGCPDLQLRDSRRTFASAAKTAGKTLDQIGELLHHTSTQTTRRYSWLFEQAKRAAVDETAATLAGMMRGGADFPAA